MVLYLVASSITSLYEIGMYITIIILLKESMVAVDKVSLDKC